MDDKNKKSGVAAKILYEALAKSILMDPSFAKYLALKVLKSPLLHHCIAFLFVKKITCNLYDILTGIDVIYAKGAVIC